MSWPKFAGIVAGRRARSVLALLFSALLAGCQGAFPPSPPASPPAPLSPVEPLAIPSPVPPAALHPVAVTALALPQPASSCKGIFYTQTLDHFTTVPGDTVDQFEANGGGVAINDLDNDGDLDIVLANHAGPNSVLWNEGSLLFRAEPMPFGESRAVNIVDVDGDGWQDIVLTRRNGAFNFLRNLSGTLGSQTAQPAPAQFAQLFQQQTLPGIARPSYAMAWGDLDGDGDLDLVTASYDASLLVDKGSDFLLGGGAGVFLYQNRGDLRFSPRQLAGSSQAMSIALFDINEDGLRDIVVANDFAVPDYAWLRTANNGGGQSVGGSGWSEIAFDSTSYSTMSLDGADVDNDGGFELFSTDMKPYAHDPASVAAWAPIMADMEDSHDPSDPQIMANVLQLQTGLIGFQDTARPRGIDASGWTWSAKFGDLDQDGWLDLYAVNGMAEATLFAHLPDHELIEANQAFRNIGNGYFRPAPQWYLASTYGGRGMSMADLDGDGDLDIVVNNLRGPAQLFENRLCGGQSLQVDLHWPDSGNTRAIGAVVTLHSSAGSFTRDVRSGSGYLSGDPARLHFGFPTGAELQVLTIRWPDGRESLVDEIEPDTIVAITRDP